MTRFLLENMVAIAAISTPHCADLGNPLMEHAGLGNGKETLAEVLSLY